MALGYTLTASDKTKAYKTLADNREFHRLDHTPIKLPFIENPTPLMGKDGSKEGQFAIWIEPSKITGIRNPGNDVINALRSYISGLVQKHLPEDSSSVSSVPPSLKMTIRNGMLCAQTVKAGQGSESILVVFDSEEAAKTFRKNLRAEKAEVAQPVKHTIQYRPDEDDLASGWSFS